MTPNTKKQTYLSKHGLPDYLCVIPPGPGHDNTKNRRKQLLLADCLLYGYR